MTLCSSSVPLSSQYRALNVEKKGEERRKGKLLKETALLGKHSLCSGHMRGMGNGMG